MGTLDIWLTLIGMTVITILTRGFFLLPRKDVPMPGWLRDALRYAPLAALVAVVAPEVLLTQGQWLHTWQAPRLWGAVAAAGWFAWRRDILGTIVCGTAVMLVLRLGLGWTGG